MADPDGGPFLVGDRRSPMALAGFLAVVEGVLFGLAALTATGLVASRAGPGLHGSGPVDRGGGRRPAGSCPRPDHAQLKTCQATCGRPIITFGVTALDDGAART